MQCWSIDAGLVAALNPIAGLAFDDQSAAFEEEPRRGHPVSTSPSNATAAAR